MPRNVRNFWLDLDVDGRNSKVQTGPARKDAGFDLSIYQRDNGDITSPVDIWGRAKADGTLTLTIRISGHPDIIHTTHR